MEKLVSFVVLLKDTKCITEPNSGKGGEKPSYKSQTRLRAIKMLTIYIYSHVDYSPPFLLNVFRCSVSEIFELGLVVFNGVVTSAFHVDIS